MNLPQVLRVGKDVGIPLNVPGFRRITLSLTAPVWNDPTVIIHFGLEQSWDGGITWGHWVSGETHGAAQGLDGSLPSISRRVLDGDPGLFRPFITTSKPYVVGLLVDVG